ncbi:MAG: hypothetical protein Q9207_003483 [Kuettlingeria erythrocarpa]
MMKKQSAVRALCPPRTRKLYANGPEKTPSKSNQGRRKPAAKASAPAANGVDGADDRSEDESSSGQAEAESEDVNTGIEKRKSARKGRPRRAHSEESVKPRRRKSAPQPRLSERLKRSAKDQSADESDESEEPVSMRPRRSRAPPINYSLLQNLDFDQYGVSDSGVGPDEPKRKSKIVALRTGPPKKQLLSPRNVDAKTPRRKASVGDDTTAKKTPFTEDVSATRKSTRGKKTADGDLADDEGRPNLFRGELGTPRRKRRRRLLAHQDQSGNETSPAVVTKSVSKRGKRKRSEDGTGKTDGEAAGANAPAGAGESPQPEKKRRKSKIREDLGFLPNGQPRKRRRRGPKNVTTRNRANYQFPYLAGYNGPSPPDMATVLARQDELERQNGKSHSTASDDSESSLASLSDDDERSELESPTKRSDGGVVVTNAKQPIPPHNPAPVSATSVAPMMPTRTVGANTLTVPVNRETVTMDIPDVVFFAEDIAKARENAAKLRESFEAEKASVRLASQAEVDSERKAVEANLAQEKERVTELTQQLADLREGFTTRMNAEKQEHERAFKALEASSGEKKATSTETISQLSTQVKSMEDKIKERDDTIQARNDTIKAKDEAMKVKDGTIKSKADDIKVKDSIIEVHDGLIRARDDAIKVKDDTIKQLKESEAMKDHLLNAESKRLFFQPTAETLRPPPPAKSFTFLPPLLNQSLPQPGRLPSHTPTTTTTTATTTIQPASQIKAELKPHVSSLRNVQIRLAGHLRTTNEAHGVLKASVERLHAELEADEISMKGVKGMARDLVVDAGKVDAELKNARRESDVAKGGVMELVDKVGL